MSVIITREDLKSYAEVDYIVKHMNERYRLKLPENLLTFFDTMKDPDYEVHINPYKPLQDQGLSKYALEIVALLHIKYWCENKARKEELLEKMRKNQEKFEAQLKEQFGADALFNNNTNKVSTEDPMVTAYSKYMNVNPDIQDYTDLREDENVKPQELPQNVETKVSFLGRIRNFVGKMFGKKA